MPTSPARSTGLALSRLGFSVSICCWIVGLALALQTLIWSLATYTDLRFESMEPAATDGGGAVVSAESTREEQIRNAREAEMGIALSNDKTPPEPAVMYSKYEGIFALTTQLAGGAGRCAMLVLLLLMVVGALLCAGSATPGVDLTVSSLIWAMIVAILVLPLGEAFAMPWQYGALTTYEHMIGWVESMNADESVSTATTLMFFARLGVLPAACIVGITLVGLRFASGIEAGIIAGENMRLDPALEREAANMSPTSLHSGRSGRALGQTLQQSGEEKQVPLATQVSRGDAPQRLI